MPRRSKKPSKSQTETKPDAEQAAGTEEYTGPIRKVDSKTMEVDQPDTRVMVFQLPTGTERPADLAAGDTVEVQGHTDERGYLTALNIKRTAKGEGVVAALGGDEPLEERPSVALNRGPKYDSDDSGPPKLKRGIPAPHKHAGLADDDDANAKLGAAKIEPVKATALPPPENPHAELIARAKGVAREFLSGLPNYVCQQQTTRYQSQGHVNDWQAQDVVSAEITYVDGKEKYDKVAIDGRPVHKNIEDTGAWSTGEFGTILADLMSPQTAADFKFLKDTTIAGMPASLYDFSVLQPRSHWQICVPSQYIRPSYRGSLWIDKKTARVLRIEMQATKVPTAFPKDAAESAVEYAWVSLGTDKYLLPAHAEILSCDRGINACEKNVIDFRNYHRYTGETKIIFK